jgi:hypothetical protein
MLDNNNQNNSTCAFAEQMVSYLYGEANVKEKAVFETHLNSCADCAEEFAGFGVVRSSVIEWRNEEFLSLETPSIEIPYEKQQDFYNAEAKLKVSTDWIAALRRIFSVSPALTASASFAIIAICLGIIFFAGKSSNNLDVAGVEGKNTEQSIPSLKAGNENFINDASNLDSGKTIGAVSSDKETKPFVSDAGNKNRKTIPNSGVTQKDLNIKISDVSRNSVKSQNREVISTKIKPAINENKKPMFAQTGKIPTLNSVEEDEDKSLRLAELLEDGDAK